MTMSKKQLAKILLTIGNAKKYYAFYLVLQFIDLTFRLYRNKTHF